MNTYEFETIFDKIDLREVPLFYKWSGYCSDVSEYKESNFLKVDDNQQCVFVCSSENGVGLAEYVIKYIFKQEYTRDLQNVLSPGCDYFFFKAWEHSEQLYDEQDEWCKELICLLISKKFIQHLSQGDEDYFAFSDLTKYEELCISDEIISSGKDICGNALMQYFKEEYENGTDLDGLLNEDVGEWALSVLETFKNSNS